MAQTEHDLVRAQGNRQLVICCDGTNNTLTAGKADTNVLKLHELLVLNPRLGRVLFYDPGVGIPDAAPPTDPVDWLKRSWSRVAGLASGRGVYDNIADGYRFLVQNWQDESDEIYCFGFSRGAFTARCIVGLVNLFGIIKPEHEVMLPTLIHIYFSLPSGDAHWWQRVTRWMHRVTSQPGKAAAEPGGHSESDDRRRLAAQVSRLFCSPQGAKAEVFWVGVWDTVESVGMPGPLSRSNPSTATLHDKRVRNVRHALALDEHRWTFVPRLYEEKGDFPPGCGDNPCRPQTLKQRWFPGDHCDVGGSYPQRESALSNHAFSWMLDEVAASLGLNLRAAGNPFSEAASPRAVRHDALYESPCWALAGMCLRDTRPRLRGSRGERTEMIPYTLTPSSVSVWNERRSAWPLVAAIFLAFAFMLLSAACLRNSWTRYDFFDFQAAAATLSRMSDLQTQVFTPAGLASGKSEILHSMGSPGWAMFWDLGFVGAYGYLLARICSRAFTWLAGRRAHDQAPPWWKIIGMAPLCAVGGNVFQDSAMLLALASQGLGLHWMAGPILMLGAIGSLVKWLGLIGCACLKLSVCAFS